MTVALGASAYSAAIFHLMTHAFFKALLFLAAGSVIIGMHHEQDMRHMGGLRKYMPITWITGLVGSLALIGFPGTAGFFSKDAIIEAVRVSDTPGATLGYLACLIGVFITALYSFRLVFLVFHGETRMDEHAREHVHETPAVVWGPLVALAIPSVFIGAIAIEPMLFGDYFGTSIFVDSRHDVLVEVGKEYHGVASFIWHGIWQKPFWFAMAGIFVAWFCYLRRPDIPGRVADRTSLVYQMLVNKYGFDTFYNWFFAGGATRTGRLLWQAGDVGIIDGIVVDGSAKMVVWWSSVVRKLQSGYLYHYAFAMILGLLALLAIFVHGWI
jgi:NADH-quinone oxidoreductase subunit L